MPRSAKETKRIVREGYAKIARTAGPCCGPSRCSCGGASRPETVSRRIGYRSRDMEAVPEGANLGLGCGNPVALASLRPGDVVLDLGAGAGFDALLAARAVGDTGRVIGVDMTEEMVAKARANAAKAELANAEFRLGTIEALPVEDASVDVVISNCVVNLSPDKPRVFAEAFRVLRPGGRLMISDLVTLGELPATVRASLPAYVGCVAGVSLKDDYVAMLGAAGFERIAIAGEKSAAAMLGVADLDAGGSAAACACADPTIASLVGELAASVPVADLLQAARLVMSVQIAASKPAERRSSR
jgi:arsenite methyltransferase